MISAASEPSGAAECAKPEPELDTPSEYDEASSSAESQFDSARSSCDEDVTSPVWSDNDPSEATGATSVLAQTPEAERTTVDDQDASDSKSRHGGDDRDSSHGYKHKETVAHKGDDQFARRHDCPAPFPRQSTEDIAGDGTSNSCWHSYEMGFNSIRTKLSPSVTGSVGSAVRSIGDSEALHIPWERDPERPLQKLPIRFRALNGKTYFFPWEVVKTWEASPLQPRSLAGRR
jgi:hypothetical protein